MGRVLKKVVCGIKYHSRFFLEIDFACEARI
jgi:hypothetical protein